MTDPERKARELSVIRQNTREGAKGEKKRPTRRAKHGVLIDFCDTGMSIWIFPPLYRLSRRFGVNEEGISTQIDFRFCVP